MPPLRPFPTGGRWLPLVALLATLLLAAGCDVQLRKEYHLNPDGSGKVQVRLNRSLEEFSLHPPEKTGPAGQARNIAAKIIRRSEGVDAWRDVRWKAVGEERMDFEGVAYFSDYTKLDLYGMELPQILLERRGSEAVLRMRFNESEDPAEPGQEDAWVQKQLREMEADLKKYGEAYARSRVELIFHLPGTVREATNFRREGADTLRLLLEGEKLIAAIRAAHNEDLLRKAATTGDMRPLIHRGNEVAFGTNGPVQAVAVYGTAPRFDYAAELAQAKKADAALRKQLGVEGEE